MQKNRQKRKGQWGANHNNGERNRSSHQQISPMKISHPTSDAKQKERRETQRNRGRNRDIHRHRNIHRNRHSRSDRDRKIDRTRQKKTDEEKQRAEYFDERCALPNLNRDIVGIKRKNR